MSITLDLNGLKLSVPKTILEANPFFGPQFSSAWGSKTDLPLSIQQFLPPIMESDEPEASTGSANSTSDYESADHYLSNNEEEVKNIIIQTIISLAPPIKINSYDTCRKYLKSSSYFCAEHLAQKCIKFLKKSYITQDNILDVYLSNKMYISDKCFLDICRTKIGYQIRDKYKTLIEYDLNLLACLSARQYCYFDTEYDRYLFVKQLFDEMNSDNSIQPSSFVLGNINTSLMDITKKKCLEIWLDSITFHQFTSQQLFKLIEDKFIPDTYIQLFLSRYRLINECLDLNKKIDLPFHLSMKLSLYKVNGAIRLSKSILNNNFMVITGNKSLFAGSNWYIQVRQTDTNNVGIFVMREHDPDYNHYSFLKGKLYVKYSMKVSNLPLLGTSDSAFLEDSHGWGWKDLYQNDILYNSDAAEVIDSDTRSVIINVTFTMCNKIE